MTYSHINAKTAVVLFASIALAPAVAAVVTEDDLLTDIHMVSSVTHMNQTLDKTPAAVTIIDRRTIEASAAVEILDLFRLVPGFRAYFINANAPGVSYHVLGDENPRRLEVKIDGRSVYESIFSAVEWTTLGVTLDDIDYIEVVRGGNAPADGSNAFLASINIVTRSPLQESGWKFQSQIGNDSIRNGTISYSGQLGPIQHRTVLSHRSNEGFSDFAGDYAGSFREIALDDSSDTTTFGFRGLWTPSARDSIELQFGVNDSEVGIGERDYITRQIDYQYQHLNWTRINSDGSTYELISYHNKFDVTDDQDALTFYQALNLVPEGPLKEALSQLPDKLIIEPFHKAISERWDTELRATFDHRHNVRAAYGAAIRRDRVSSNSFFDMADYAAENSYRGSANFEWHVSDRLTANSGVIVEYRDDGDQVQSYRVASNYQMADGHTLRLAFNRGYRAPTLLESHQATFIRYDENLVLDAVVASDTDIDAEKLTSSELGYAGSFFDDHLHFDMRLFSEKMSDVISERRIAYPDVDGQLNIRDNTDSIEAWGMEWQAQYRPSSQFLVHANYSFVDLKHRALYRSTPTEVIRDLSGVNPRNLGSLLVNYVTRNDISLSAMLSYQSKIRHFSGNNDEGFKRLDIKAAKKWRLAGSDVEVALTIQNLGSDYREYYFFNQFSTRYVLGVNIGFP
jgi:iron complex outermembrane receptor protein